MAIAAARVIMIFSHGTPQNINRRSGIDHAKERCPVSQTPSVTPGPLWRTSVHQTFVPCKTRADRVEMVWRLPVDLAIDRGALDNADTEPCHGSTLGWI